MNFDTYWSESDLIEGKSFEDIKKYMFSVSE